MQDRHMRMQASTVKLERSKQLHAMQQMNAVRFDSETEMLRAKLEARIVALILIRMRICISTI